MLGDNSEKSRNPLKKAMRRRNAKSVSFSSPTYIEASDVDFGTDDEMEEGDFFDHDEDGDEDDDQDDQHEDMVVEPLKPRSQREKESEPESAQEEISEPERTSPETARASEDVEVEGRLSSFHRTVNHAELANSPSAETVSRSRNGTVRNTDSFFKDDTAEPKKISLTPNLLRDETSNNILLEEVKEVRVLLGYHCRMNTNVLKL